MSFPNLEEIGGKISVTRNYVMTEALFTRLTQIRTAPGSTAPGADITSTIYNAVGSCTVPGGGGTTWGDDPTTGPDFGSDASPRSYDELVDCSVCLATAGCFVLGTGVLPAYSSGQTSTLTQTAGDQDAVSSEVDASGAGILACHRRPSIEIRYIKQSEMSRNDSSPPSFTYRATPTVTAGLLRRPSRATPTSPPSSAA